MKQAYKLIIAIGILILLVVLNIFFLKLTKSIFEETKSKIEVARNKVTAFAKIADNKNSTQNISGLNVSDEKTDQEVVRVISAENTNQAVQNETKNETVSSAQVSLEDKEFNDDVASIMKIEGEEEITLSNIINEEEKNLLNSVGVFEGKNNNTAANVNIPQISNRNLII